METLDSVGPVAENCFEICDRLPSRGINIEPFTFSKNGTTAVVAGKNYFAGVYCDCEKKRENGLPETYGWTVSDRQYN